MKITYLPLSPGLRTLLPTVEASSLSAALDYLTIHSKELKLNREQMFLTGDSAGGNRHRHDTP